MNTIYVITGQTATGKTQYALDLARRENGELINCDSRQIYKDLTIVTGKDIQESDIFTKKYTTDTFDVGYYTTQGITIWLYDIVSINQTFSAFDFEKLVITLIIDILKRGKTPIIIGGSFYYLYHLLYNVETASTPPDLELRKKLNNLPIEEIQAKVKEMDALLFEQLNNSEKHNRQRLIRKIELLEQGKDLSHFEMKKQPLNLPQKIGDRDLNVEMKAFFHTNLEGARSLIEKRVIKRIENGAVEEVSRALHNGFAESDPGLQSLGCKEIIEYVKGALTKQELVSKWTTAEMQYAKRQATFIKKYIETSNWVAI